MKRRKSKSKPLQKSSDEEVKPKKRKFLSKIFDSDSSSDEAPPPTVKSEVALPEHNRSCSEEATAASERSICDTRPRVEPGRSDVRKSVEVGPGRLPLWRPYSKALADAVAETKRVVSMLNSPPAASDSLDREDLPLRTNHDRRVVVLENQGSDEERPLAAKVKRKKSKKRKRSQRMDSNGEDLRITLNRKRAALVTSD